MIEGVLAWYDQQDLHLVFKNMCGNIVGCDVAREAETSDLFPFSRTTVRVLKPNPSINGFMEVET